MRWLAGGLGIAVGLVVILAGIGYSRPNAHVAQVEAEYDAPPGEVYRDISDVENWPEWHPGVTSLTVVEADVDQPAWRITGPDGAMTIRVTERDRPRRFRTLADGGMFLGRWTYRLEPQGGGTRLTITEEGRIDNILVRGIAVFRDKNAAIVRMMRGLGAHLGETVEPQPRA